MDEVRTKLNFHFAGLKSRLHFTQFLTAIENL